MPTPMPIMIPRVGANSGTVTTLLRMITPAAPAPTPTRAVPMVMPMATTEPTARISTNTANASPMASDSGGSRPASHEPPISTRTPSARRPLALIRRSISSPISAASLAVVSGLTSRLAYAMRPASGPRASDAAFAVGIVGGGYVDALDGLDLVEQVGHGGPDGWVVHALLRSEHDGAGDRGADIAEVRAEDVGTPGALGVGRGGRRAVGRPESAGHPRGHNDDQQPGSQNPPRMPVAEARQRRVHNRAFLPGRLVSGHEHEALPGQLVPGRRARRSLEGRSRAREYAAPSSSRFLSPGHARISMDA